MTNRETFVAMLAQTLAPKFFEISGDVPEEMGFPFGDSKEDFDERMERQFNPVDYWTAKATEYAEGLATIFEAGGVDLSSFDYDAAVSAMLAFRADLKDPAIVYLTKQPTESISQGGYEPDELEITPAMLHAAGLALCRHSFEGWEESEAGTLEVLEAVVLAALAAAPRRP